MGHAPAIMAISHTLFIPEKQISYSEIPRPKLRKQDSTRRFQCWNMVGRSLIYCEIQWCLLETSNPQTNYTERGIQVKFVDDASQIASINLKQSLIPDDHDVEYLEIDGKKILYNQLL